MFGKGCLMRGAVFAAVLLLFAGCGRGTVTVSPDADCYRTATAVMDACGDSLFSGSALLWAGADSPDERIEEGYAVLYFGDGLEDIDMERITDYAIAEAAFGEASQFGVIRLRSPEDAAVVTEWIKARSVRVSGTFTSYKPEEKQIADGWEIRTAGDFVYYCASCDNEAVFRVMEDSLSG